VATFKQIQDDVLERIGNSAVEARVRVKRFVNEWHRRLCTEAGIGMVRDAETTLTLVAGTDEYTLAAAIRRIRGIQDETRGTALDERSLEWMRQVDPDDSMSGDPQYYAMRSDRKIKLKPVPSGTQNLTIDYETRVVDLDDDADEPLIPEDFHYLLVLGARINEYEKNDDMGRMQAAQKEMGSGIGRMKFWIAQRRRHVITAGGNVEGSRLGAWYPKGS
jgi:hypothetical protein